MAMAMDPLQDAEATASEDYKGGGQDYNIRNPVDVWLPMWAEAYYLETDPAGKVIKKAEPPHLKAQVRGVAMAMAMAGNWR